MKKVKLPKGETRKIVEWFLSGETDCHPREVTEESLRKWWGIYVGAHVSGFHKFMSEVQKGHGVSGLTSQTPNLRP